MAKLTGGSIGGTSRDRITRALVASAAAAALFPCTVPAGSGDLDPAFASQGVYLRPVSSGAWVIGLPDDGYLLAGGLRTGFIEKLEQGGVLDPGFSYSSRMTVFDVAIQADGKIVAVGTQESRFEDTTTRPSYARSVLRLNADGTNDTTFDPTPTVPQRGLPFANANWSIVLATDGRIVVAGSSSGRLIVERYLTDGSLDATFADGGRFVGPDRTGGRTTIVAVPGGYRVLARGPVDGDCRVLALTADGDVDASYGDAGYVAPGGPAAGSAVCASIVALPDGGTEVVGQRDGAAFAARLTASGDPDGGFEAVDIPASLRTADAVAVDVDGSSVVAGASVGGESGVRVTRLRADGTTDTNFGDLGTAWVDLTSASTRDLALLAGGSVLLAGAAVAPDRQAAAFAARLLGATSMSGAGVLGLKWARVDVGQQATEATLTVRRTGGASGPVNVSYRTRDLATLPLTSVTTPATAGIDYVDVSGHFSWTSGDTSERVIRVPLGPVDAAVEDFEAFEVELYAANGAAIGTGVATVVIDADGPPAGYLALDNHDVTLTESVGSASIAVTRKYHSAGAVSVTVVASAASASAGSDFDSTPVTLTWADGELGTKLAVIPITNDVIDESTETFTLELRDATGGALIEPGTQTTLTVTLNDDDFPPPDVSSGGGGRGGSGGGGLDGLVIALLVAARIRLRDVPTWRKP